MAIEKLRVLAWKLQPGDKCKRLGGIISKVYRRSKQLVELEVTIPGGIHSCIVPYSNRYSVEREGAGDVPDQ